MGPMLEVLMLFPREADRGELEAFLSGFIPSVRDAPGLRSHAVSSGELMSRGERPPFTTVVRLSFDSLADWMALIPSAERREERDRFDRLGPLVLFYEASEG